jgi:hypothetical protein
MPLLRVRDARCVFAPAASDAAPPAPAQGRAPYAAARALRLLGRGGDARAQLAAAEALGWTAALSQLRRALEPSAGGAGAGAADARGAGGSGSARDADAAEEEEEEEEEDDGGDDNGPEAVARAAVAALLRDAAAAAPPPPRAPPLPLLAPRAPPPDAAARAASAAVACRYVGHRHAATIKDVSFLGDAQQFVCSGSDDGRFFIWARRGGRLLAAPRGDASVVNCVQSAPGSGLRLASCGIDCSVKLWAPTADAEAAAAAAADAACAAAGNAARRGGDGGRRGLPRGIARALAAANAQREFATLLRAAAEGGAAAHEA